MKEAHTWGAIDIDLEDGEVGADQGLLHGGRLLGIRPNFQQTAQYAIFNFFPDHSFGADNVLDKAP